MSLRGGLDSRSGLVPGLRFGVVENAVPPQPEPRSSPTCSTRATLLLQSHHPLTRFLPRSR